jgi:membrane protease YdiL (CAAX protease family)
MLLRVIRQRPLTAYFTLAFGVTWSGIFGLLARHGFDPSTAPPTERNLVVALMLLGPCSAGIVLTALLDGRNGLRDLRARLTRWRVDLRWAAVALLTVPMLVLLILWPLSLIVDPAFTPGFKLALFPIGLVAGLFEEVGWTGFATPRLLRERSVFTAGLLLGALWAVWHMPADFSGNFATMGQRWWAWILVFWIATLPAYRLLMTCVYSHTQSALIAILMHASYTGWLFVLYPATSFAQGLVWQSLFAASLWVVATAVIRRGDRTRSPAAVH